MIQYLKELIKDRHEMIVLLIQCLYVMSKDISINKIYQTVKTENFDTREFDEFKDSVYQWLEETQLKKY